MDWKMENKKRVFWKRREIQELLSIIKENYVCKLFDKKNKRNKKIFDCVAKEMMLKGFNKNGIQIRTKFKSLKRDYYKSKCSNNTIDNQRNCCDHFDILDAILCQRPSVNCAAVDTKLSQDDDTIAQEDPLVYILPVPEVVLGSNEIASSSISDNQESSQISFKTRKKQTYRRVVDSFTKEWKKTQEDLLEIMKQQDLQYLESIEGQNKKQEKMLETHRKETERILENDRQETAKMLTSFINILQPRPYFQPAQQFETSHVHCNLT